MNHRMRVAVEVTRRSLKRVVPLLIPRPRDGLPTSEVHGEGGHSTD